MREIRKRSARRGRVTLRDAALVNRPAFASRPVRWLILGGVVLIAAIAFGTAVMIGSFRERSLASAERELENTVMLLARHFDQQLQQLELAHTAVIRQVQSAAIATRDDFERAMSGRDVHLMLKAKIDALPHVGSLSLNDVDGKLINSANAWPVRLTSISDRKYFQVLKSEPHVTTVLSEPVLNHVTGAWTTVLARKITAANGAFLGAVVGSIQLAQFDEFFASLALGEGAAISIFHRDGTLLARYPRAEASIGQNFSAGPLFQHVLSKADHGTMRLDSPVDGRDRLGSVRNLGHFPVAVIATKTVAATLADWQEQTRLLIGVALSSALTIVALLFLIIRQLSRHHRWSRARLLLEKRRLDVAVNNMTQGLLLFDASERLVICNQRYLDMYGLSPEVIKPGCSFRDVLAHRKAT